MSEAKGMDAGEQTTQQSDAVLTFGSLFAGIGGFDLGLERARMRCVWQVEIDDYARRVLEKHWPDIPRWDDVRTFPPAEGDWGCDLICGGFPCQDISYAGEGAGIEGQRSGLWSEFERVVRTLRPRYVVVENVAALLTRGLDRVLGDLAACGYDAEWDVLAASDFGAPHIRERVFVVAADASAVQRQEILGAQPDGDHAGSWYVDNADCGERTGVNGRRDVPRPANGRPPMADASEPGPQAPECEELQRTGRREQGRATAECGWWATEPDVGRVAHGIPRRVDRLRTLGNSIVPQVAEWIGRRIVEHRSLRPRERARSGPEKRS